MHSLSGYIDGASILTIIGALAGFLPPLATLLAIVWYAVMLYEWFEKRRAGAPVQIMKENPKDVNDD